MSERQQVLEMNDFASSADLEAALDNIAESPVEVGEVCLIVCRPAENQRKVLALGRLDPESGLEGDYWCNTQVSDDKFDFHRDTQINLVNARLMQAIAPDRGDWPAAGDQFYVDFNLADDVLPAGTRFRLGTATLIVTEEPHRACGKFAQRFGQDAVRVINAHRYRHLNLRGINARVLQAGQVRPGDQMVKL